LDQKLPKSSTILFINIFIILIFIIFIYVLLYKNINLHKSKNKEVIFYQAKEKSNILLSKLLHKYFLLKDKILEQNTLTLNLLKSGSNLDTIYYEINKDYKDKPFDLYILDKNLSVEKSSISFENYLDLSYTKDIYKIPFLKVLLPKYIDKSQTFISYINTKIPNSNKILQLSFSYNELENEIKELQNFLNSILDIQRYEAFIYFDDYLGIFTFKDTNLEIIHIFHMCIYLKKIYI